MFFFSGLCEMFGYFLCHFNDKFGRKTIFAIFLAFAGVMCLAVAVLPRSEANVFKVAMFTCTGLGKAMVSGAFNCAYVYTSQMYPTHMRSTLLIFVGCLGKIGALISPQINLLRILVWKPLPYLIFSSASLAASFVVFIIPDPAKKLAH